MKSLQQEIKRLRKALKHIVDYGYYHGLEDTTFGAIFDVAKEALEGERK